MTTKKLSFNNGICKTNTGYRRIIIDPTGNVRPVLAAVRSGYRSDRHTIQTAQPGDIILHVEFRRDKALTAQTVVEHDQYGGEHFAKYTDPKNYNGLDLFPDTLEKFRFFLKAIELSMEEQELTLAFLFLAGVDGRGESFLPAGLGWNGNVTLGDKAKENRIRRFLGGPCNRRPAD